MNNIMSTDIIYVVKKIEQLRFRHFMIYCIIPTQRPYIMNLLILQADFHVYHGITENIHIMLTDTIFCVSGILYSCESIHTDCFYYALTTFLLHLSADMQI